jgi:hypothetical protein
LCAWLLYKISTKDLSPSGSAASVFDPKFIIGLVCMLALYIAIMIFTVIAIFHISLGQTILYRDMLSENTKDTDNTDE